jgi:hypothetical protein
LAESSEEMTNKGAAMAMIGQNNLDGQRALESIRVGECRPAANSQLRQRCAE